MSKKRNNYNFNSRHKAQSSRQLKVSQIINSSIMSAMRRETMADPRLIGCPLTITKVTISPDLKLANCFFMPFNTDLSIEEIAEALEQSRFHLRKLVTEDINLKYSPELRFFYDSGFENAIKIDELLKK